MSKQDPKLTGSEVTINYTSDDGYGSEHHSTSRPGDGRPHLPLLAALEELARVTALFGFEAEALERFNAARKRVADWRAAR